MPHTSQDGVDVDEPPRSDEASSERNKAVKNYWLLSCLTIGMLIVHLASLTQSYHWMEAVWYLGLSVVPLSVTALISFAAAYLVMLPFVRPKIRRLQFALAGPVLLAVYIVAVHATWSPINEARQFQAATGSEKPASVRGIRAYESTWLDHYIIMYFRICPDDLKNLLESGGYEEQPRDPRVPVDYVMDHFPKLAPLNNYRVYRKIVPDDLNDDMVDVTTLYVDDRGERVCAQYSLEEEWRYQ